MQWIEKLCLLRFFETHFLSSFYLFFNQQKRKREKSLLAEETENSCIAQENGYFDALMRDQMFLMLNEKTLSTRIFYNSLSY